MKKQGFLCKKINRRKLILKNPQKGLKTNIGPLQLFRINIVVEVFTWTTGKEKEIQKGRSKTVIIIKGRSANESTENIINSILEFNKFATYKINIKINCTSAYYKKKPPRK